MASFVAAPVAHRSQSTRGTNKDMARQRRRSLSTATRSRDDDAALAWDGLRKDTDLWFDEGDCLVHLYAFGASRRGPSFQLRADQIETLGSSYLIDQCLRMNNHDDPITTAHYEIYLPAGSGLRKDEAYAYHVTTRNCFAFVAGVPLVGQRLGQALIDLWDRLQSWDARHVTLPRFYEYCERQGYLNLGANAGNALAVLAFAEHIRDSQMYIDAFVHCAGMQDWLELNPEYSSISEKSKLLIGRAGLEMELHIAQVSQSMSTFLEDELSPLHLNLSPPARDHLDRFRSFLINHYVDKHGYYPPPAKHPWKKSLWLSMYHAFQCLYEYLADTHPAGASYDSITNDTIRDIHAFDQRHGFEPLPYQSPLLPTEPTLSSSASIHSVTKFTARLRLSKPASSVGIIASKALETAANTGNPDVMSCSLVKEYRHFERQKLEEKLSAAEARQVRWMLVYSTLQMLISIIRAPAEVRDVRTPTYPLCVLTADCPPWEETDGTSERSTEDSLEVSSDIFYQEQDVADDSSQTSLETTLFTKESDQIESFTSLRITTRTNRSDSRESVSDSSVSTLQTPRSSSSISDDCDSPITESSFSGCDLDDSPPLPVRRRGPLMDNEWRNSIVTIGTKSLNVGCYEPTGLAESARPAMFCHSSSAGSVESFASSIYPEEAQQAADIAEVSTRGRGRITSPGSKGYNVEMPVDLWVE